MNPESENFDALRRLLALKRHEQPPPGYFDRFSGQVLTRIRAGESGEAVASSWTQWFWSLIEAKPAFAGAFGVAVCTVLVSGILNSEEAGLASSNDANLSPMEIAHPFAPPTHILAANVIEGSGSDLTNGASSMSALFENYPSAQPATLNLLEGGPVFAR